MMRLALERCFAPTGVRSVYIDPLATNRDAHRFYERLGFRYQRDHVFGDDHCRVYCLDRDDWTGKRGT